MSIKWWSLTDKDIVSLYHKDKATLLGKAQGIATRWQGNIEIPQTLYEYGFVEHCVTHCGSTYARSYDNLIIDNHPMMNNRSVEL